LLVGAKGTVLENQSSAGIVTVTVGGRQISLSREMAASILVRSL
jgi:Fe2+ transport system protein FeoA